MGAGMGIDACMGIDAGMGIGMGAGMGMGACTGIDAGMGADGFNIFNIPSSNARDIRAIASLSIEVIIQYKDYALYSLNYIEL